MQVVLLFLSENKINNGNQFQETFFNYENEIKNSI